MRKIFQATALALALALTACGGEKTNDSRASKSADETWKIGVIMPLSGSLAAYGGGTLRGVRLMEEKINAAGGLDGRPVELMIENNEGDKTKSAAALRKLAGLKNALAVIGPITSTNALEIGRDADKKGIVLITPTGTNDDITACGPFVFRACFKDSFQGVAVAKFAFTDLAVKKAAIFQDATSDYSVGLCKSFAETFKSLGGEVLPAQSYKQGDMEFTAQLRKIREMGAEAIFIPGYPPELPLIINEAVGLGIQSKLLGSDGWDNVDVLNNAGVNLNGTYFAAAFSPQMSSPPLDAFLAAALAAKIENPGSFEALGYDSLGMIGSAILNAGGAKELDKLSLEERRRAIQKALASLERYAGATGSITMQPSGDPLKSLVMLRYEATGGEVRKTFVKSVEP